MRLLLHLLLLALSARVLGAETPIPATLTSRVTDTAGFLSPAASHDLEARLATYEQSTGRQVFVFIAKTTGGTPLDDWAVRAFKTWKVGRKGLDNGVVLFIMSEDRHLRIEVGYGLEGQLTDAYAGRIVNDVISPKIVAGDRDGAAKAGVDSILSVIDGKGITAAPPDEGAQSTPSPSIVARQTPPMPLWQVVIYGIFAILFLIVLATHPSFALYLLINILSGGNRGGGGGGTRGGGFRGGGGGRSGGGGASGSW